MEDLERKTQEDYKKYFSPKEYRLYKLNQLEQGGDFNFSFKCLCEFFTTEQYSGDRLLELGSGPTVYNIATASAYFPYIVMSEFVESNCDAVRKWLNNDPDCLDWTPFLQEVAKAEQKSDLDAAVNEIESRIRSSVKAVIHCDVLNQQVIDPEYCAQPFDVILTSLTFEAAAVDWEAYSKILHHVKGLLRKGGKLIMVGVTMVSSWSCGNAKFNYLPVEEAGIQKALEVNGFGDIKWKLKVKPDDKRGKYKKAYFVTSTKL